MGWATETPTQTWLWLLGSAGPGEELVSGQRVDDPLDRNLALGGTVAAEGDLDFRGTLGVSKEAPVGLTNIRLRFDLESTADEEQLALLKKLTERYCVIYQTLARPPQLELTINAG